MVHRVEAVGLVVPFEEREIHHPERREGVRVAESEPVAHLYAQHSELCLGLSLRPAEHENEVSCLRSEPVGDSLELVGREELVNRRLDCSVRVELYINQTLCAHLRPLDPFGEFVKLFASVFSASLDGNRSHILDGVEDGEIVPLRKVGDFVELHAVADVRLVGAVVVHRVVPAHPRNRVRDGHIEDILEKSPHHSLECVEHILLLHE